MLLETEHVIQEQLYVECNGFVQDFFDLLALLFWDLGCSGSIHALGPMMAPDKSESEKYFTQFNIFLLKVFNYMIKGFVPCCVVVLSS